ncbi:hypothetical protein V8C42DRAFT_359227 [Trichoderma barbatum]
MKPSTTFSSMAVTALAVVSSASPTSSIWDIKQLTTVDTASTDFDSAVQFQFLDQSSGLSASCSFFNPRGSGVHPPKVAALTHCDNPRVEFTYNQTGQSTGQIDIKVTTTNAVGKAQLIQSGTGIAGLACSYRTDVIGTVCTAASTRITPGKVGLD